MKTFATITFRGVELQCDCFYTTATPDCGDTPGTGAEVEIESIEWEGKEVFHLISSLLDHAPSAWNDLEDECLREILGINSIPPTF